MPLSGGDRILVTMYAWYIVTGTSAVDFDPPLGRKYLSEKGRVRARELVRTNTAAAALFEQVCTRERARVRKGAST